MERSAWPKNLSSSRKRAIKELLHAQKPTKKLRDLFDAHSQASNNTGQSLFSEDLVGDVLRSFSNTLSLSSNAQSDEVLQLPTNACVMSEVSEKSESIKTPVPRKTLETRTRLDWNLISRGHQWRTYNQKSLLNFELPRKTLNVWTVETFDLIGKGYLWRKYGQRPILNSKFPRKYFRYVHHIDQGCQATKLVQRTSHEPRFFLITYRGRHTCKIILNSPPLILDSPRPRDDSTPLSFNTSLIAEQDDNDTNNPIFLYFLSVNQERKLPSKDDLNPRGHNHDDNSNNNNQAA